MTVPQVVITKPGPAWLPSDLIHDIVDMKYRAREQMKVGPYIVVYGKGWEEYMEMDYQASLPTPLTVRQRVICIHDVISVMPSNSETTPEFALYLFRLDVVCEGVS